MTEGQPQPKKDPKSRRFSTTVCIVILLFAFIYNTVVFVVARYPRCVASASVFHWPLVYPWLEWSVYGVFNIALFTFLTGTAFVMYICCIVRDPGRIPHGWTPDTENANVLEVKKDGEVRYCQKCNQYKPPRSHHCRVCDRCVLRMDHHCVWINNCVGHNNYRAFLLFLIYVTSAVLHGLVLLLARTFHGMNGGNVRYVRKGTAEGWSTRLGPITETLATIISFPLVIALGLLLGWHIYLVAHNKTTIEYHEGVRSRTKGGQRVGRHIYDLGMFENPHSILGGGCWLLPGCAAEGDGLTFPTAVDADGRPSALR